MAARIWRNELFQSAFGFSALGHEFRAEADERHAAQCVERAARGCAVAARNPAAIGPGSGALLRIQAQARDVREMVRQPRGLAGRRTPFERRQPAHEHLVERERRRERGERAARFAEQRRDLGQPDLAEQRDRIVAPVVARPLSSA